MSLELPPFMKCKHEHKACKDSQYGKATGKVETKDGRQLLSYTADVALWLCNDCDHELWYDWHTHESHLIIKPGEMEAWAKSHPITDKVPA